MPLPRTPDAPDPGAQSDLLDRDGVGLVEAGEPADRPVTTTGRPRRVELTEQYVIREDRMEQVLAFLLDFAPHLLVAADHDPLRGLAVGDPDVTAGSVSCSAQGPARADGTRPLCSRGLHPSAWDHLCGDGRDITDRWTGDYS